jgi:hypothetical protein
MHSGSLSHSAVHSRAAVLVSSCDAYDDLWRPFFSLWEAYWPDCHYPVYLGAGEKRCDFNGVTSLASTGGRDWSLCLTEHLEQLRHEWVLLLLDDFFLRRRVSTRAIEHCLDFAVRHQVDCLRLVTRPGPTHQIQGEALVGECAPELRYRVNTQGSIWRRDALLGLLRKGESIWEFEHKAGHRAIEAKLRVCCTRQSVLPYEGFFAHHVVEKGRWFPHEKWLFRDPKLGCDFTRRSTLSWRETLLYQTAHGVHRVLRVLPWNFRQRLTQGIGAVAHKVLPSQVGRMSGKKPSPAPRT